MGEHDRRFWPFKPYTSIVASIALLIGLLFMSVILRKAIDWPGKESETTMLIGVTVFSILPIALMLVDNFIERGGVIEYRGIKIDFSKIQKWGSSEITISDNVGLPNQPLNSSSTRDILKTLKESTTCNVAIIDLKEGQAWWETRLLILLAGAVRLKKPEKVVFVGKDGGVDKCFQGWSHPSELLPLLLQAHPQYPRSYYAAQATARQWELVEPINPFNPTNPGLNPPQPNSMQGGLTMHYQLMAFDQTTGLPNELRAEQLLATDLGDKMEKQPKLISIVRLEELFRPVLYKWCIDESWPSERQIKEFFDSDSDYFPITQKGKYTAMVSRLTVLNAVVRTLVEKK